jgi:hypothetical protein
VTYRDYQSSDEDIRCEVLDGRIPRMNFSPLKKHQDILGRLFRVIGDHLDGKTCDMTMAPFDVYLFETEEGVTAETDTWVEPNFYEMSPSGLFLFFLAGFLPGEYSFLK